MLVESRRAGELIGDAMQIAHLLEERVELWFVDRHGRHPDTDSRAALLSAINVSASRARSQLSG